MTTLPNDARVNASNLNKVSAHTYSFINADTLSELKNACRACYPKTWKQNFVSMACQPVAALRFLDNPEVIKQVKRAVK